MSNRMDRANSQLQKSLSEVIQKLNDPRLSKMIYVSEVSLTPDFKYCKIKVSIDSTDEQEKKTTIQVLQKSEGFIKRELASLVKMPQMPKLSFVYDKGAEASMKINEILKNLDIPKGEE